MSNKNNWSLPAKIIVLILFGWSVTSLIVAVGRNLQKIINPDLPVSPGPASRTDGCVVGAKAAKVHKNYEDALVQFVENDGTVQVKTFDTKLAINFKIQPDKLACFHRGSITPVTIKECVKNPNGECNFFLSHTVYVRTEYVKILNWKYN